MNTSRRKLYSFVPILLIGGRKSVFAEFEMDTIAEEIRPDNADTVDEKMDTDEKQTNCYWWVPTKAEMKKPNLRISGRRWVFCFFFVYALFVWFDFSGKDRNLNILELLCATCSRWFHESCIGFQLGKMVPFATNYTFFCKNCSPTGLESFRKNMACKLGEKRELRITGGIGTVFIVV